MEKKIALSAALLVAASLAGLTAWAQVKLPQASPNASVSQTIGVTNVTVSYSRPSVRGRVIWGGLEPYDAVWRTGANENTTLAFADSLKVAGQWVPPGTYSLYTIPGRTEWVIILNKNAKHWGEDGYKSEEDQLRFRVKPTPIPLQEQLTFSFDNATKRSADLVLQWEKIRLAFPLEADADEKTLRALRAAIAKSPNDERVLAEAANYCVENKINLTEAGVWVDKVLSIREYWWYVWLKANVLAAQGKTAEAISWGEKALAQGKAKPGFNYGAQLERDLNEWRAALKKSKIGEYLSKVKVPLEIAGLIVLARA